MLRDNIIETIPIPIPIAKQHFIYLADVELKERIIAWKREKRDKKLQLSLNPNVKS